MFGLKSGPAKLIGNLEHLEQVLTWVVAFSLILYILDIKKLCY